MSRTDCESSSQGRSGSSKTSAASETFRDHILQEGYQGSISATPLVGSQFPEAVLQRQGPKSEDVARLGETLRKGAAFKHLGAKRGWLGRVWWPFYNDLEDIDPSLGYMANVVWWKDGLPQSRNPEREFAAPRPDIAIGFRVHEQSIPLDSTVLLALHEAPDLCLRPCPDLPAAGDAVAYPTFVHQIEASEGTQRFVENRLSRSLVWLLHQQDELRKAALEVDMTASNSEFPIFGITSVGGEVTLFSATGTSSTGFRIVKEGNPLDLIHPAGSCAFAAFSLSALRWTRDVYLPQIAKWIATVHAHLHKSRQEAIRRYEAGASPTTPIL